MNHLSVRADKTSSKHNQTGKTNYQKVEKFNPPPPPQINMPPLHKYMFGFRYLTATGSHIYDRQSSNLPIYSM